MAGSYGQTLGRPGLQAFLWTQFLGAFNDNICRMVVTFLTIEAFVRSSSHSTVSDPAKSGAALVGVVFILPFLLFSGYAGHLADVVSKRRVLIGAKWLEVAAMVAMIPALVLAARGVIWPSLGILFMMALQATIFSPAKYGLVPEAWPADDLSRANGLLEMSTFVAIVLGTAVGGELFQRWRGEPWITGGVLVVLALIGVAASYGIPLTAPARAHARFPVNPFGEVTAGARRLAANRNLLMTVVGLSFFWFLGALIQLAVLPLGIEELGAGEAASARLFTALALGIGAGSLVAGRLSGDRIELGLVPIGGFGMGLGSLVLVGVVPVYWAVFGALCAVGFAGGWFAVPLNALLQQKPDAGEKGRILATNNVANTVGILLASAVLYLLGDRLQWSASRILGITGVFTLLATMYVLTILPDFFVRFVLWMLTHTIYRITILGRPNIPARGPALIIANHVSMIDGALVGACVQRFIRFLVFGPYFRNPAFHWLLSRLYAIPVTAGNKQEVTEALERARAELVAGHVVCIFIEGAVSRTGNLLPVKRGFEKVVRGLDVPVIPVYLDRVWGSVFSFKRGRFFWKLPERLPYPVTVSFGTPLPATISGPEAHLALMELSAEAVAHRQQPSALLHTSFMRVARRRWRRPAIADSTGQRLTYGRTLVGAMLLADLVRARVPGESRIGLLLPASVGGALANLAILMAGRVPVNLNFTTGPDALRAAVTQAGIRTVVTSRRFLEKAGLAPADGMVFLEDLRGETGGVRRIVSLVVARLLPLSLLRRRYGGAATSASTATIIFSSGSTGVPKGIVLSHANVLANVSGLEQVFPIEPGSCFIGVLPLFHSFGFTGTLWFPLLQGCRVVFHPNPMDAKTVGELAGAHKGNMLISTPTFCHAYLRRCTPDQFAHLQYVVVGAEKLREPLAASFKAQFGVALLEGYGCTEMAPVVAVNRPDVRFGRHVQAGSKAGSVGHPIPGVAAKIVDQDTGQGPLFGQPGLLLVKGPNLMQGYLDQPERTAEVMRDGWYVTGDIALIDDDGFVFITDRLSRFSKIGGEMVPHVRIEEAINAVIGEFTSAVTAIPDPARGERLVAFYTRGDLSPDLLWEQLCRTDLPRLWLPKREHLVPIAAIPTLGTGKVDLRRLREMALEHAGEQAAG
jgi:acyl-[acyl-carrier-protein]-phospholipid O-acyltransferase/long-chain-fatty-acid--[acyl-carrier-protein] ligase